MASLSSFADDVNLLAHAVNLLWSDIKGSCVKNCATICLLKKRLYLCSPNKYANNNK